MTTQLNRTGRKCRHQH